MSTTLSPAVPTHDPDVITRLAGLAQRLDAEPARLTDPEVAVAAILATAEIEEALIAVTHGDVDDQAVSRALAGLDRVELLGDLRRLRSVLTLSVSTAIGLLARVLGGLAPGAPGPTALDELARRLPRSAAGDRRLVTALGPRAWVDELAVADPHAIAATSPYRRSAGHVVASADDRAVEAVMSQRTFTSLRVVDGVLRPGQRLLADLYAPLGRCVALVDENVLEHHGDALTGYFDHHRIELVVLPHRGMEVDKGIRTVERMLGELKAHGVARNEPVLVVGGGVLADTAGLACSLYHRSTPYVM
ncbi:MAG: 3-dehydroquinate synthase, partial [Actinomycetota bacterium]